MKKINFNGKRICFYIILLLIGIYFSFNVYADDDCRDYNEYCSGLANGGQTTAYTRGEYCYFKIEVGIDDTVACQKRFDSTKKCWTTEGKKCSANEKCTATGCKDAVSITPQPPQIQIEQTQAAKPAGSSVIPMKGDVEKEIDEHGKITVSCFGGKITELQAYYSCIGDFRSTFCPLKKIGDDSGLTDGGIGKESATFRFDNGVCVDPCNGIKKRGKLIAKCSQQVSQPAAEITDKKETETLPGKPSETAPASIAVKNILAISAPKIVASSECINDTRFDFDNSTKIDLDDYFLFAANFNLQVNGTTRIFDLDNDNSVDFDDFFMFSNEFGKEICKEALGDNLKSSLNNCNVKCDDVDGCSCLNACVYGNIEQGQTCGDKKSEEKTAVESIVETVKNIFTEPNHCEDGTKNKDEEYVDCGGKDCKKCLDLKEKSKTCKNLEYGDKCEVEFNIKINAGKGSNINLPAVFEYKGKKISKDSVLAVSGVKSSSEIFAVTGSTVWDVGFTDVTGNVVQGAATGSSSRFNCVLKNRPEICCPFGFRVSSQDSNQCVRDEIVIIAERNLYGRVLELAQKYLNAKGEEKDNIKKELRGLE